MSYRTAVPGFILLGILATPAESPSCGPVFPEAVFSWEKTPRDAAYVEGKLGVIRPTFWRRYLVIAYRYLSGVPLTKEEIASPEPAGRPSDDIWKANDAWRKTRESVTKSSGAAFVHTYRSHAKYQSYDNCKASAFDNAARTLDSRVKTFGVDHPGVKAWVAAQDAVFANCSQGQTIPPEPEPGLPPALQADRQYQIASAHFYSESFEEAYARFRKIAADRGSPWSPIAPYLAVRCLVRETTLSGAGKFEQALRELDTILAEPRYKEHHEAARSLRAFVLLRIRPQEVVDRIGAELRKPANGERFRQNLVDFDYAWERGGAVSRDDMGEWISKLGSEKSDEALAKWRAGKQPQWLVAAMISTAAKDESVPELLAAAEATPESSPAYATVLFHRLRLIEESGKLDEVRAELDRKLPAIRKALPPSAVNSFLAQRMRLARNFDEFLRFAPRRPVGFYYYSEPDATDPKGKEELFDDDAISRLNRGLPLSLLRSAALGRALPANLSDRVLMQAFARAAVLGRHAEASELTAALAVRRPVLKAPLDRYRSATTDAERNFAIAFVLLRAPALAPHIGMANPSRDEAQVQSIDEYKQNWWCAADPKFTAVPAPFLTADQRKAFDAEWEALQTLEAAPNWLGKRAIEWAKAHPEDPASPEALHLTVRSTRYGCAEPKSEVSKSAFTLLHARWPRSEWARKTPYWY